jgi:GNAT superfamily N-acetyltransferase
MQAAAPPVFAVESFAAFYADAANLLRLHWDEVAPHKELLTLNPDLDAYDRLEKLGMLCVVTARQASELIGYVLLTMHNHHHYKHVKIATDDIHFLHPLQRKGSLGSRLIAAAEEEMKKRGVQLMAMRTKVASNHGRLFERRGYVAQDLIYTKRLGG